MSEWKHQLLTDLFNVEIGGTPSRGVMRYWANDYDSQAYSWVSIADMGNSNVIKKTKERITTDGLNSSNAKLLPINTLIFSFKLTIGKIAITGVELTTNEAIAALIPKGNNVETKLIYYLLPNTLDSLVYDTAVKGKTLNKSKIAKITFFIPLNIGEQRKIATILSTVDKVIEKTEAAIEKYKAIKAGMMQDLFTRGIDVKTGKLRPSHHEAPELYKETELGFIPKEWVNDSLGQICEMKSGDGITSKSIDDFGNYPVYGGNGLRGYTSKYSHDGSYILIGRQGALCGNVIRVNGQFYASEHAVVVTVNNHTDVDWLSEVLDAMKLNDYSEASAQPGLAVGKILRLKICVPKQEEQRMIASVIQSLNKKVATENDLLSEFKQIKQGLMADMLTGYVRTV